MEEAEAYSRTQLTQTRDIPKRLTGRVGYTLMKKEHHEFFNGHITGSHGG